jgi:hypothetical protein
MKANLYSNMFVFTFYIIIKLLFFDLITKNNIKKRTYIVIYNEC